MNRKLITLTAILAISLFLFVGSFRGVEYFLSQQHQEGEVLGVTVSTTETIESKDTSTNQVESDPLSSVDCLGNWEVSQCPGYLFSRHNNQGQVDEFGENYVFIFNPSHPNLDFKVNLPISHPLYILDLNSNLRQDYQATGFESLVKNPNSKLDGKEPVFGINGDYVDTEFRPQGLNVSRGLSYSGDFASSRSSFSISKLVNGLRQASINKGLGDPETKNFNTVGGNGRFYENGVFKNICDDLGQFACLSATNRSMAAVTDKGYVIMAVHQTRNLPLYPSDFKDFLEPIARQYRMGKIQEGMLFDGGRSPGFFYDGEVLVENGGPIGSVFLVYTNDSSSR